MNMIQPQNLQKTLAKLKRKEQKKDISTLALSEWVDVDKPSANTCKAGRRLVHMTRLG